METDEGKNEALTSLIRLSQKKGYILLDDIMNCAEEYKLSIQDVDWLSNSIVSYGVLIYDDETKVSSLDEESEYNDFAQTDYEEVFNKVVKLSPNLETFINDIRAIIPPQHGEVRRLKYQIQEGNLYARQRMIEMYLRVAVRIALQRAESYDLDITEAIGDACVGLIIAVDKYDPDTCGPFNSYASFWIFQNIGREQGTCRPLIYYPVHRKEPFFTMYPLLKKYGCIGCHGLNRCNEVKTIVCKETGYNKEQADEIIAACMPIESIDLWQNNADTYAKEINQYIVKTSLMKNPEDIYDNIERKQIIQGMIEKLNEKEREIIRARYGFDDGREKTLKEVGQIFGVSRERIRQIESKALKRLSQLTPKNKLKEFL